MLKKCENAWPRWKKVVENKGQYFDLILSSILQLSPALGYQVAIYSKLYKIFHLYPYLTYKYIYYYNNCLVVRVVYVLNVFKKFNELIIKIKLNAIATLHLGFPIWSGLH